MVKGVIILELCEDVNLYNQFTVIGNNTRYELEITNVKQ